MIKGEVGKKVFFKKQHKKIFESNQVNQLVLNQGYKIGKTLQKGNREIKARDHFSINQMLKDKIEITSKF